jgi:hypothetical protein
MTTSIDPSVDELLLLEENQSHMSNFVLTNIKPIGVSSEKKDLISFLFVYLGRAENWTIDKNQIVFTRK